MNVPLIFRIIFRFQAIFIKNYKFDFNINNFYFKQLEFDSRKFSQKGNN